MTVAVLSVDAGRDQVIPTQTIGAYADLHPRQRELHTSTRDLTHALAALQHR